MIKKGLYCVLNGNEYKYNEDMNGDKLAITSDKSIIDSSFIDKYSNGIYI